MTGVTKTRKTVRRKIISLQTSAEDKNRPRTMEDILGLYKPRKKAITLRLDADVLEWFKKEGPRYQTRINRALRQVMREEQKESHS